MYIKYIIYHVPYIYHMINNIFDMHMICIIYLIHCIPGYARAWCMVEASLKSWSSCLSLLHVKVIGMHHCSWWCANSSRQQFYPLLCLSSLLQLEYGYDDPCYDRELYPGMEIPSWDHVENKMARVWANGNSGSCSNSGLPMVCGNEISILMPPLVSVTVCRARS